MIKFTYKNYKHVDCETVHSATLRPASDYCIPDQILDALRHTIPTINSHLVDYNKDAKKNKVPDLVSAKRFPGRKVPWDETLTITKYGLSQIAPIFETIFVDALNTKRISARPVVEGFPTGNCYLTNRGYRGPHVRIDFEYDESIGDVINSFHEMGHMSAAELCGQKDLWDFDIYERHIDRLSAETQSQFIEFFAYDPGYLPQESKDLSSDLNVALRFVSIYRAKSLISKFEAYDKAVQAAIDPFDDAHERLHSEMYIPGTFLASRLFDLSKNDVKKKAEIVKVLYPAPGEYDQYAGYPPFPKILALAGISNQQELNKLFEEQAIQIFSSGIAKPESPNAQLALKRTTAKNQPAPA